MLNDQLLMELSAFADGELDAAATPRLQQKLAARSDLQRELALLKRLDSAAAKLPVPSIPKKLSGLCTSITAPNLNEKTVERIAQTLSAVPTIPAERFDRVWCAVAAQTIKPSAEYLDALQRSAQHDGEAALVTTAQPRETEFWRTLDQAAAALPVPQLSDLPSREAWHAIAQQTVAVSNAEKRLNDRIERAALVMPAPVPGEAAFAERWNAIAAQVSAAPAGVHESLENNPVPEISRERWNTVWNGIAQETVAARPAHAAPPVSSEQLASPNVTRIEFSPVLKSRWSIAAAASVAAMLLVAVLVFVSRSDDTPMAMQIPEALDDRYDVHVNYLASQSEPVVCFFLKDNVENTINDFRWLPD